MTSVVAASESSLGMSLHLRRRPFTRNHRSGLSSCNGARSLGRALRRALPADVRTARSRSDGRAGGARCGRAGGSRARRGRARRAVRLRAALDRPRARRYRVTGADRSPVLLDEARRRAGEGSGRSWVEADHRELAFEDASFDAALNLFSALGYRGEEGTAAPSRAPPRAAAGRGSRRGDDAPRPLMHIYQQRSWNPLPEGDLLLGSGRSTTPRARSRRCTRWSRRAATASR